MVELMGPPGLVEMTVVVVTVPVLVFRELVLLATDVATDDAPEASEEAMDEVRLPRSEVWGIPLFHVETTSVWCERRAKLGWSHSETRGRNQGVSL